MSKAVFGIIGLGVMGSSLAKNIAQKGFSLAVYNRSTPEEKDVVPNFLKQIDGSHHVYGTTYLNDFVDALASPKRILLMVNAGPAVDEVIKKLIPLLSGGDIIIDGGNSYYADTQRRCKQLEEANMHFVGAGISGGEQGALTGPSMMVGCALEAYQSIQPIVEAISAKDTNNMPCVTHVSKDGSGHFVKMIHNGIEYAEMQLLAECYGLLRPTHSYQEIANILKSWNDGPLSSYLLQITSEILTKEEDGSYLLDKVLDIASSKGTGSWSSQTAFQLGIPASMINSAVTARYVSSQKELRVKLEKQVTATKTPETIAIDALKATYQFARIINHHQGFEIIKEAAKDQAWDIDLSEVARIWTQGCIIKSSFMETLATIFKKQSNILDHPPLFKLLENSENEVTKVLNNSFKNKISTPCISSSYQFYISMITGVSTANLIQAQRDEFGAHTYRRTDQSEDRSFTSKWTNHG